MKCVTVSTDQTKRSGWSTARQGVGTGLRVGVAVGRGGGADILGRRFCSAALASEALAMTRAHLFLARLELLGGVRIVAAHLCLAGPELLDCLPQGCPMAASWYPVGSN